MSAVAAAAPMSVMKTRVSPTRSWVLASADRVKRKYSVPMTLFLNSLVM